MDVARVYQELLPDAAPAGADVFRTHRLDEAQDFVARMFVTHGLAARADASPRAVSVGRAYMGPVAMHAMDYGRQVRITPKALEDFYLIQIPVTGSACIEHGSHRFDIGSGEASLLPAADPIAMTWAADCRHLVVQVDRVTLEREAALLMDAPLRGKLDFDVRLRWADPRMGSVRGAASALYEASRSVLGLPGSAHAQETLCRAFCQLLLLSQPGSHFEQIRSPRTNAITPGQVRRAEEYIRQHLTQPIGIEEIARAAGVSTRCLFDNFRRFRGSTPMQYVRERRMEAVRRDLESAGPQDSVTAIATRWGFTQLGRFSAEYRLRFGENPSLTLQRARPAH